MLGIKKLTKSSYILLALLILAVPVFIYRQAQAAFLSGRSITLSTPIAGSAASHTFRFTLSTPGTIGSIRLEYCDNDPYINSACTVPPGLDMTAAVLTSQNGETGFSIDPASTANDVKLTRPAAAAAIGPVEYVLSSAVNPSTSNTSTYVRISTYASTDTSGLLTDQGGVVFSTSGTFGTNAFVPPQLYFCVGVTVAADCSSSSGDSINFGELKSSQVSALTTQLAAATNDPTGYVIYSLGTTMISGNNVIPPIASPSPSVAGINQFGINLRDNNNPNQGQDVTGTGTGTVFPDYNTANLFMFNSGAAIAEATQSTDYSVYTTTYITNISFTQPPGVYATTITYLAVAQF